MTTSNFAADGTGIAAWDWTFVATNIVAAQPYQFVYTNMDGSWTYITGTGFTYGAGNIPTGGSVTLIEHRSPINYATYASVTDLTSLNNNLATIITLASGNGLGNYLFSQQNDVIIADGDGVIFYGNADFDRLFGGTGADHLFGGGSYDLLIGFAGDDVLDGGSGFDEVRYHTDAAAGGTAGVIVNLATGIATDGFGDTDTLSSIERVLGTEFNDTLIGNADDNRLRGGAGDDIIDGGSGHDVAYYDPTFISIGIGGSAVLHSGSEGIVVNLVTGAVSDGFGETDTLINIEEIFATQFADSLTGSGADETFYGLAGRDTIDGGAGIDTARYDYDAFSARILLQGFAGVTVDLSTGTAIDGFGNTDTLVSIENVVGTYSADNLIGNAENNWLDGLSGTDSLYGDAGHDILTGGSGADSLYGGDGDDAISGDGGADFMYGGFGDDRFVVDTYAGEAVVENANGGTDVVYAHIDYTVGLNIEQIIMVEGSAALNAGGGADANVIIGNSAANVIYGYGGDDVISGGDGANSILGGDGNDAMDGQGGTDQMIGGLGNDSYVINAISDVAAENANEGIDTVYAEINYTLSGNLEQLILREGSAAVNGAGDSGDNVIVGNSAANLIYGNDGADTIYGLAGADSLLGNGGSDVLDSGQGNDVVIGGSGADQFKFIVGDGADTVNDFSHAEGDHMLISTAMSANFADLIANHSSVIGGNVTLSFAGGQVITMVGIGSTGSLVAGDFVFF